MIPGIPGTTINFEGGQHLLPLSVTFCIFLLMTMMAWMNNIVTALNEGLNYLHTNAFPILICVAIFYWLRGYLLERTKASYRPLGGTITNSTGSNDTLTEDLARVRQLQQEEQQKRSLEAAKLRKMKEEEDRKRRNESVQKKKNFPDSDKAKDSSLRTGSSEGRGGYNPLQPWSSNAGGGYK